MNPAMHLSVLNDNAFALAVGRLSLAWTDAETDTYRVLVRYAGVSDAVGRALFHGTRSRQIVSMIEAILRNTNASKVRHENISRVFAQLELINRMRDRIVHHAGDQVAYFALDGTRVLTNDARASHADTRFVYEVPTTLIDNMTDDLHLICNHLNMHWSQQGEDFKPWSEEPADASAWRYKPPAQEKVSRKKRPS